MPFDIPPLATLVLLLYLLFVAAVLLLWTALTPHRDPVPREERESGRGRAGGSARGDAEPARAERRADREERPGEERGQRRRIWNPLRGPEPERRSDPQADARAAVRSVSNDEVRGARVRPARDATVARPPTSPATPPRERPRRSAADEDGNDAFEKFLRASNGGGDRDR